MPSMSSIESLFCRSAPWRAASSRFVLPWALQGTPLQGDVLEIGGGSGAMAARILDDAFPTDDLTVTVTDFDPVMVDAAKRNLHRFGDRFTATTADATALPFPDESFDVVISLLMLHHVIDWEGALADAARVLRPGGVLVGYDLVSTPPSRVVHVLDRSPHRFIGRAELLPVLDTLPFASTTVKHAPGLARFRAIKSPA